MPTTISISAPFPADTGESPSAFLDQTVQGFVTVTSPPQSCTVGTDPAVFLTFTSGASVGYMVLWFHFGDYYLLQLKGSGGVDRKAV
jgi:hypothetical protein